LQSTALEIGERLAGQQSSNSCSVGPCFFISKGLIERNCQKTKLFSADLQIDKNIRGGGKMGSTQSCTICEEAIL